MIERILFHNTRVWVVLLVLLFSLLFSILFGWVVKDRASGDLRTGALGDFALEVAESPSTIKKLIFHPDAIDHSLAVSEFDPSLISNFDDYQSTENFAEGVNPIYWVDPDIKEYTPLVLQSKVGTDGEENFFFFDEQRNLVKKIRFESESMTEHSSDMGNSPAFFLDNGDFIMWSLGGTGLSRYDTCGNTVWQIGGLYHHHYNVVDGNLFILGNPKPSEDITRNDYRAWNWTDIINVIDAETGEILRSIGIDEIARANMHRFDPLLWESWRDLVAEDGYLNEDIIHLNKIEVLPAALRDEYPMLPEGAMMLSSRVMNLVFVFDPVDLKIHWYSHGMTQVQHDPKFIGNGEIAIFNNSYDGNHPDKDHPANFTNIRVYDFNNDEWSTRYNAVESRGYTFHTGNYDISEEQNISLTLSLQGRYLEVDSEGKRIFDFFGLRDSKTVHWSKESQYLPQPLFNKIINTECASS